MKILIKIHPEGKVISLNVKGPDTDYSENVKELKEKIFEKEGIPIEKQKLLYSSMVVDDDNNLSYYNVIVYSILNLVIVE